MAVYSMESLRDDCYPNSTVLINKLDIKNQEQLTLAEQRIVTALYAKAEYTMNFNAPDFEFYTNIHKYLFCDLYEWAGTIRKINIEKKGTVFCDSKKIEEIGNAKFLFLKQHDYFKGLSKNEFISEISELYNDLNYLHPFREGNGRTLRLFMSLLVKNAGYTISFSDCDNDFLMIATIKAIQGDVSLLRQIFNEIIQKSVEY